MNKSSLATSQLGADHTVRWYAKGMLERSSATGNHAEEAFRCAKTC